MIRKRFMRVIVMFDLPITKKKQQQTYRRFRKWLIKSGFIMMQQSIYSKIVLNPTAAKFLIQQIRNQKVEEGLIQAMVVTETQYASIECIVGNKKSEIIDDMRRLVVI
ncbi:MAG: CRISPR-associated endonuclease Cas2 [Bacilli bacterium]|nr:CRISPR-associated endonuclease Cas2 [Bacilli bacterium]